jgi:integrase
MKITDTMIRSLKPKAERYELWEPNTRKLGTLGIRVGPTGRKTWVYLYWFENKARRLTFGRYPEVSVAGAHDAAGKAMQQLERGIDPGTVTQQAKQEARTAPTVEQLVAEYQERELASKKSSRELHRLLVKDVVPEIGQKKARDVTRRDIVLLIDKIKDRGSPVTANRVLGRLVRLFNFAIARGIVEQNPCTHIEADEESARERVLDDFELRALWSWLTDPELKRVSAATKLALRLAILTGQRMGEICGMRWDELDLATGTWTIPPERLKTGHRIKRAHVLPLTTLINNVIEEARQLGGMIYVLPSPVEGDEAQSESPITVRACSRLIKRYWPRILGGDADSLAPADWITPHDIRRSVRTRLAALGVDELVSERLMGHTLQGMLKVYNQHDYLNEMKVALSTWKTALDHAIYPEPPQVSPPAELPNSKVVPLRRAAA